MISKALSECVIQHHEMAGLVVAVLVVAVLIAAGLMVAVLIAAVLMVAVVGLHQVVNWVVTMTQTDSKS